MTKKARHHKAAKGMEERAFSGFAHPFPGLASIGGSRDDGKLLTGIRVSFMPSW